MPDDLMTAEDVAAQLKVHIVTVRRRMDRGEFGPLYRNGRKCVRIYRTEYEAHVKRMTEEQKRPATVVCHECGHEHGWPFTVCPECGEEFHG